MDDSTPATQPAPNQSVVVEESSAIKAFEYDPVGNREKEHAQSETVQITRTANEQGVVTETRTPTLSPRQTATASFDQLNRLTGLLEADGSNNVLSYDNNGNLLSVSKNSQIQQSFEYDPRNQLRKVLGAGGEVARFDYDVDRKRIEKTAYGYQPQRYVYAGDSVVTEYNGASGYETIRARYQIGADEVVRGEFDQNEGARYFFNDALGSTTLLAGQLNGSYTGTSRTDYDSWGVPSTTGGTNNSIGYTGQRLDSETGLMALGNGERYYSPVLARFIQQDSFTGSLTNGQSLNRFSYGYNNPYRFTDPSGNKSDDFQETKGIDDLMQLAGSDNVFKQAAGWTGIGIYAVVDTVSGGYMTRSDRLNTALMSGKIGVSEFAIKQTVNAGVSALALAPEIAAIVATGGTSTLLRTAAINSAGGAASGVLGMAVDDGLNWGLFGDAPKHGVGDYVGAGLAGGALGFAAPFAGAGASKVAGFVKESAVAIGSKLRPLAGEAVELGRAGAQRVVQRANQFIDDATAGGSRTTGPANFMEAARDRVAQSRAKYGDLNYGGETYASYRGFSCGA